MQVYAAHIQSAKREWEKSDAEAAWMHLDACQWNLRSWEHDYLYTLFSSGHRILHGHTRPVDHVAFSPNGRHVVSADRFTIRIFDVASGQQIAVIDDLEGVTSLAYSPDGTRVASGLENGRVTLWDSATGREMPTPWKHGATPASNHFIGPVNCIAFSPDGTQLAAGADNGSVVRWNLKDPSEWMILDDHTESVTAVAYSRDGKCIASGARDKSVRVYDTTSGAVRKVIPTESVVQSVVFSPDGQRVTAALSGWAKSLRTWDLATDKEVVTSAERDGVTRTAFSPDSKLVAYAMPDGHITLWDVALGVQTAVLRRHMFGTNSVAFSSDGRHLVSGADDRAVIVWDLPVASDASRSIAESPSRLVNLRGLNKGAFRSSPLVSLDLSPDGRSVVGGIDNNTAKLWDTSTGANV